MSQKSNSEQVFLQVGFRSPEREGSLRAIELFGVPGEKLSDGNYKVSKQFRHFFDDLIVRKIFSGSRRLPYCDFEYLKIWLYDMDVRNEKRYQIPKIDERDLEICSDFSVSSLERIYVLDNELTGCEYEKWKRTAEDLFTPLFSQFITPPEPPDIFRNNPFTKVTEGILEKVDPYTKMKQSLFFNALIIQID